MRRDVALAGVLCAVLGCRAWAAEYYVDASSRGGQASDANPGTKEKPWATLSRVGAADKAPVPGPGDTVIIRGGTYKDSLVLKAGGAPIPIQ